MINMILNKNTWEAVAMMLFSIFCCFGFIITNILIDFLSSEFIDTYFVFLIIGFCSLILLMGCIPIIIFKIRYRKEGQYELER